MAANTSEANELQADAFISVVNLNKHDTHRTLTFSELSQAIREQCKKDGTVFNSLVRKGFITLFLFPGWFCESKLRIYTDYSTY